MGERGEIIMAKVTPGINNFNAGEVSPLVDTRWDVNKYASSCKTLQNALPLVEGGAKKMPGTYYVNASKDDGQSRLVPFSFSTDQSYVLEFSEYNIRVFWGDGMVQSQSDTDNYDPTKEYFIGDIVSIGMFYYLDFPENKSLFIAAPLGLNVANIHVWADINTTDDLDVRVLGSYPNEEINIFFANTTGSKNAADLIQAAIRNLGTVNGIDVTEWTVTPNEAYYADGGTGGIRAEFFLYWNWGPGHYQAIANSQYFGFPYMVAYWTSSVEYPTSSGVEVTTPYKEEDLFDLDVATQSADILWIFHKDYPAAKLKRYSHTWWKLEECEFTGTQDITKTGYQGIAKFISGITQHQNATVTCVNHGLVVGEKVYINHVLGMVDINQGTYTVQTVTDANNIIVSVDSTNFIEYDSGGWLVKVIPLYNRPGEYPGCGTFYEQRLMLAGFENHTTRLVGSVQGDYENFISDPELDDYAIQFDLVSSKIDPFEWMVAQNKLVLGTASGIWVVSGSGGGPLTPTSVEAKKQVTIGTGRLHPEVVNDSLIWFTRVTRIARLLQYVWNNDQWVSPDLTRIARHITIGPDSETSGIIQTAFQKEPYPILWAVRKDGQLLGMTYESQEQVYAWFRVVTDGTFESIAVVPRQNDEDRVWVVVKR